MTVDAAPYIAREDINDEDLLRAITAVKAFMQTSNDLRTNSSFFAAEDNNQNRDILHVTSSILGATTQTESEAEVVVVVAEEKDACEARWDRLWSSESKSKFASCGESPVLREFYNQVLPSSSPAKWFIPLCGVSKDLVKLAEAGHEVVGLDISSVAVQQLIEETSLDMCRSLSKSGAFEVFCPSNALELPGKLSILHGDVFEFPVENSYTRTKRFTAVLDIRSLLAIPVIRRKEYVRMMENIVEEGGRILLEVVEHEQQLSKPPFSISHGQVLALYANAFDVKLLRTQERGAMIERVYLLVRKAIGIPRPLLPKAVEPSVQRVFRSLQAVARRHLQDIGTKLGMNTLGLTAVGDLDVLRFLNYKGKGSVLEKHVDPGLLTVHIGLEEDACVHADETDRSQEETKNEAVTLTVFSSDQLGVVTRGKLKPSAHQADAQRARFAMTFNCYVDSNILVAPMDGLRSPSQSMITESGLDYVERIFGKLEVAKPEGSPEEGPVLDLNLTMQDLRSHWTLLKSLYSSNEHLPELDTLKQMYATFLNNIRAESLETGRLEALPTPPVCIRVCWVAHMLQPSTYRRDCLALFGEVLPHCNGDRSEVVASVEFREWWQRYALKQYPETKGSVAPRLRMNWEHLPSAKDLYERLLDIGASFMHDDAKALHLLNDYKRYILAAEKHPSVNLAPGPLIDIVWHSHQTTPVAYNADMSSRVAYLDHLPRSEGEDVKPWLLNTIKAWKDMYPGSKPPMSASIQAGCGCCYEHPEAAPHLEEKQKEERERAEKKRRLKKENDLNVYNLNESFHTIASASKSYPWHHAKVMHVSTGACSFDVTASTGGGSTEAKTLVFREPLEVSYAFSSDWRRLNTREDVLSHISYRMLESNENSHTGVKIEDAKELRYECPQCSYLNVVKAPMFEDICQSCSCSIQNYTHSKVIFVLKRPDGYANSVSYSAWDLCALSSSLGTASDVFLTREGLTLVVFNFDKVLKATQERRASRRDVNNELELSEVYKVRAWLKTIHFSEPQACVGLVGICSGSLKSTDVDVANKAIAEILKEFPTLNVMTATAQGTYFFPLAASTQQPTGSGPWSMEQETTKELKRCIQKVVCELQMFTRPLPVRWIWCLKLILQSDDDENVLKKEGEMCMEEIREVAKTAGITSVDEIENMLHCFHLLGFVFHFNNTDPIVYTKPQLLVQEVGKVLLNRRPVDWQKVDQCGLMEDFKEFKQNAVISRDLLEYFWGKKRYAFLIDFMQSHYLLAGYGQVEINYYVPSLLMGSPSATQLSTSGWSFQVMHVPQSVYYRLVCLCISHSPPGGTDPILTRLTSKHWFGYECTLKFDDELEQLEVHVEAMHASRCLALLVTMLNKLSMQNVVLLLPEHGEIEYAQAKKQKIRPWFRLKRSGSILAENTILN